MGEPLSIVASVASLISLGIQVTQTLVDFYNSYKHRDSDLVGTIEKLDSLLITLKSLKITLSNRNVQGDETSLIGSIETSIQNCDRLIHELQRECQKFSKSNSSTGFREIFRVAGRRAIYPFRQSTLQKIDKDITELRGNLSIALNVLQLRDNKMIQDGIANGTLILDLVRTSQIPVDIHYWLKAPDATVNHNAACVKKHLGTGVWFLQSSRFQTWLTEDNSFLWLHGFAGSGKSVLASTVIEFAFERRISYPSIGTAFFYFTFNDDSKQDQSAMLLALLVQLSDQLRDGHSDLTRLYASFNGGTPTLPALANCLLELIEKFHHVYIILDALDEIPPDQAQEEVLNRIQMIRQWSVKGLHLLVTSRDLYDIRKSLKPSLDQEVKMRNIGIDKDIENFISSRLHEDPRLRKWWEYHNQIEETLAKRSQGVFRWVECQLQSLKSCPCSENLLNKLLNTLPRSLDETYERILCSISDTGIQVARRILTLLCFAARPLTVLELLDGIAVDISSAKLDPTDRLRDVDEVLATCPGLIEIDISANDDDMIEIYGGSEQPTQIVRIAHFSVQEYLESERIGRQKAAFFSLSGSRAHTEIAQICLIYWLEPGLAVTELDDSLLEKYPLTYYAAEFWHHHYKSVENSKTELDNLILKLFQRQKGIFHTWIKLLDTDELEDFDYSSDSPSSNNSPVYYAALLGLGRVLQELLYSQKQENVVTCHRAHLNAEGGYYGYPLEAASSKGHEEIVDFLVKEGANIHARGGFYGNALQAAAYIGHEKIVQLLIKTGADVNAHGGYYGDALQAASKGGHEKIVQILIENGADPHFQGDGHYGNALQAASESGHEKIVQRLIEQGADIHAKGGHWGNPLQAASRRGHENIVQLLIDKGADIYAECELYGNALQAASEGGHEKIVRLMIEEYSADVNAQGGYYGNALQAASERGHEKIMQLLIEKGADIHANTGHYGNTLHAASRRGHENAVRLLIEKGANLDIAGKIYGNALHAASDGGHEKIVELLIEHNADIHAEDALYGNALQAASARGYEKIVRLLIARGADIHAEGGCFYGNALQAASLEGHEKIVELLIEEGSDVNAQDGGGGQYGDALQAASWRGHEKIVKLLIEKGADVNPYCYGHGDGSGSALQAASEYGHENIVRLLIENGARVDEEKYDNALQAALDKGHEKIVQLLIESCFNNFDQKNFGI